MTLLTSLLDIVHAVEKYTPFTKIHNQITEIPRVSYMHTLVWAIPDPIKDPEGNHEAYERFKEICFKYITKNDLDKLNMDNKYHWVLDDGLNNFLYINFQPNTVNISYVSDLK